MKRKLSLLLAVVMILGSFSFAFAKEDVKPADFLEDKGVLLGDESGDLMLDKPLERRDAVVMLSRLLGVEKEAKAFEEEGLPTWEDNNDKYYNGFLAWAQSNEYFEGHSEEKFGPRDNITVREYAVVLLRALGYKEEAGVWKEVFDTAKKLGLLEGLDKEADDEILRGEMADMTFIALGTKMKGSDKTLADELGIEMPAPKELKAVVNDTENLKEVVVELSNAKLADEEKLEDVDNYRIDKFKVADATVVGDDVILLLDKALVKGRSYDLTIRNIDKAINGKYSFKANDNTSPKVENVEVLGEYGIKLTVSEPVKLPDEREFLIDGKNVAMEVEQYGRDIILTPYHKSAFSANAETLTVKSLEDFAGYKAALEDFEIEIAKDDVAPEVVDVIVKGNVVEVTFDKDIYKDSVEGYVNRRDVGNISYRSGRHDIYTLEEKEIDNKTVNYGTKFDTNKARYVFEDDLPRRTEVTIVGVQNHSKVEMEKTTVEAREVKDDLEPEIIDVDVDTTAVKDEPGKSSAKITLEFDKAVTGKSEDGIFDVEEHFDLYEQEVASRYRITDDEDKNVTIEAQYKKDKDGKDIKDTIVVEIKGLNINEKREYDYILEVRNFRSQSGGTKMYRDYVDFEIKEGKDLKIDSVKAEYYEDDDESVIVVNFNRAVDRRRAEDETNYLFRETETGKPKDVEDLEGEIEVHRNGKSVTITIPEFDFNDRPYLEVAEALRDKDNNKLIGYTLYDLRTEKAVEIEKKVPEEESAITYINDTDKVITELKLNKDIDDATSKVIVKYADAEATVAASGRYVIEDADGIAVEAGMLKNGTLTSGVTTFDAIDLKTNITPNPGKYTLEVIIGKETSTLPITILETEAKGKIVYNGVADKTEIELNGSVADPTKIVVPYDIDLRDINESNFTVTAEGKATEVKELTKYVYDQTAKKGTLTVTLKAENGTPVQYKLDVERAAIDSTTTKANTKVDANNKKIVKVTVLDAAGNKVTSLDKDNFIVSGSTLESVTNEGNVYTLTVADDLATITETVTVTDEVITVTVTK